jgi:hypothetical protein
MKSFKFLDVINYLAPEPSFLKAFKIAEQKGYFPYEFFGYPSTLDYPELPPYEAFYSLK